MDRRLFLRELLASASLLPLAACAPSPADAPPSAGRGAHGISVLDFGARGDGAADDSAAFQRAIDAAGAAGPLSLAGGARVVVPFRPAGYRVAGLHMRSYVELVGIGGHVRLTNTTDTDTILCDGMAVKGDGVIRRTRIANFHLQGNPRSGSGIVYVEHADNVVERVRIKSHGGDGVSGRKKPGGAKSDGLVLDNVWIDDNRGCGLRLGTNSHYCQVRGASRLSNNDAGNIYVKGVSFTMFGGVVAASLSGVSVLVERAHGGGFFGTEFEATPSQAVPGTLLRLGTRGGGRALGMVFDSCVLTASGNPAPVVLVDVANAENISIRGGLLDSNSAAGVVAVRVGKDSRRIVLDNVRIGGNAGSGGFRAIDDATGRLVVR